MANTDHIRWLRQGVTSWNRRRKSQPFTPDLSGQNLEHLLFPNPDERAAGVPNLSEIDLSGAILRFCDLADVDLSGADLRGAELFKANLRGGRLQRANLWKARLAGADLTKADLWGANLSRADLTEAVLAGALLQRADLRRVTVADTDFRNAVVDATIVTTIIGAAEPEFTDLSGALNLPRSRLKNMDGDTGAILPDGLWPPATWPDWQDQPPAADDASPRRSTFQWSYAEAEPALPARPAGNAVALSGTRMTLAADDPVPPRSDIEAIFGDLREAAEDLHDIGNLSNQSPMLAKGIERFLRRIPARFADLEQVRFGVALQALHLQYAPEKPFLEQSAVEKTGFIDALLMQADLIVARLPDWQAFLAEEQDEAAQIEARLDDAEAILEHAAEALAGDPAHFDASLFERIREYLEDKTIEAYLASKNLLLNIAHRTFTLARELLDDTLGETRKQIIKNVARALQVQLGAVLLDLAGLLPAELTWLVNWLTYLPKLLG